MQEILTAIATFTGVAGFMMAVIAFKKTSSFKSLDLRVELKKEVSQLNYNYDKLQELMNQANKSKKAISSAMGQFQSGHVQNWFQELKHDQQKVKLLFKDFPAKTEGFFPIHT